MLIGCLFLRMQGVVLRSRTCLTTHVAHLGCDTHDPRYYYRFDYTDTLKYGESIDFSNPDLEASVTRQ